jgi:hypothetical protein
MNAKKQYSKPQLIEVGDAIKATLGLPRGRFRDFRFRRLFRIAPFSA